MICLRIVNPYIRQARIINPSQREEAQKESNRKKSKVSCRVEHVFGFMEQSMRGLVFRGVGIVRAKANITEVRA